MYPRVWQGARRTPGRIESTAMMPPNRGSSCNTLPTLLPQHWSSRRTPKPSHQKKDNHNGAGSTHRVCHSLIYLHRTPCRRSHRKALSFPAPSICCRCVLRPTPPPTPTPPTQGRTRLTRDMPLAQSIEGKRRAADPRQMIVAAGCGRFQRSAPRVLTCPLR